MSKHKEHCIDILKKHGPLLSSEFVKLLVENTGVKEDYARQIILRLKNKWSFQVRIL